ncbi:GNAT family N-acetyltransferase [Pseudolysinimonas sp.]|uniref:GNAT family N-acetyltransferase n=1 Tax=Pseudolysinimonas sp. TaxID=2680009 RepID=UPI0037838D9F
MTVLEAPRLRLRPLTAADTDALLAYRGDADVCRYLPFPPMDAAEIARRLETQWFRTELAADDEHVTLGAELRETGQLVGDVILFLKSRQHGNGEVGWVFHPSVAGQGYATEAATAMLDWAFGANGLRRVVARLDARNDSSARLCERLGMRREAHLVENEYFKDELTSELDYAILSREWAARRDGAAAG